MIGIGRAEARSAPEGMEQRQDNRLSGRCTRAEDSRREIEMPADGVGLFSVCRVRAPEEKRKKRRDPGWNRMGKQSEAGFASWRHHVASSTVAG
jgi:hypothetical protein